MPPRQIAVLGGGITGLTSAFHLSRRYPDAQVTVLEKSGRHGGWLSSKRVDVRDGEGNTASVCLESGPRSLRPNSQALLELINLLGLQSALITTPTTAAAARTRYLHIPGTHGLTQLPASLTDLLVTRLGSEIRKFAVREPWRAKNTPPGDESFDAFLERRFGRAGGVAQMLGSALVHGIYAADSRVLSVNAAFPTLRQAEACGRGSVVLGMFRRARGNPPSAKARMDYELGDMRSRMQGVSVYSFTDGIEMITRGLRQALNKAPNVSLRTGAAITALRFSNNTDDFEICTESGQAIRASHVVSALPLRTLNAIRPVRAPLPHLTTSPTSTVTVINIVFPPTRTPIHPPGFGYLIPRPNAGYGATQPGVLGTVFDSCATSTQDVYPAGKGDGRAFTKLTMMLGGPHPLSAAHAEPGTVLSHLQEHLQAPTLPEPVHYEAHVQRNCIPIPTVGHMERMAELREVLAARPWYGRLEVVGAGVGGVSVGDCVEAGRNVGSDW